jgi:hypothetical protein
MRKIRLEKEEFWGEFWDRKTFRNKIIKDFNTNNNKEMKG